jgi:ABC-type uncharacterized transport system substrate-binding protein
MPTATSIALLVNPTSVGAETLLREAEEATHDLGLSLLSYAQARIVNSMRPLQIQPNCLVIGPDSFFTSRIGRLAALTVRHAVHALYEFGQFATAGGLMSYGPSLSDSYRLLGVYTGRVLKGAKPADLPVEQSVKFELVINAQTARMLG